MDKVYRKKFIVFLLLFIAMPFLVFHLFIIGINYFRSAIEIPIFLIFPIVWICSLRIIAYMPEIRLTTRKRFQSTIFHSKNVLSLKAIAEAIMWYILIFLIYYYYHIQFNFPKSAESWQYGGIFQIIIGYVALFITSFVGSMIIGFISVSMSGVLRLLRKSKIISKRLGSAFLIYLGICCLYSAFYRLISIHDPKSFEHQINTTLDALYYSTVTITTLGYGDIKPASNIAKISVISEALLGIFLLAILIGIIISISIGKNNRV